MAVTKSSGVPSPSQSILLNDFSRVIPFAIYPTTVLVQPASATHKGHLPTKDITTLTALVIGRTLLCCSDDTHLGDRILEFQYGDGPQQNLLNGLLHTFFSC